MFEKKKDCGCKDVTHLLENHEKQHTKEHWVVIVLLAINIALQLSEYVS